MNRYLDRQGALWQKAFYDHALRKEGYTGHCAVYRCQPATRRIGGKYRGLSALGHDMAVGANLFALFMNQ